MTGARVSYASKSLYEKLTGASFRPYEEIVILPSSLGKFYPLFDGFAFRFESDSRTSKAEVQTLVKTHTHWRSETRIRESLLARGSARESNLWSMTIERSGCVGEVFRVRRANSTWE